MTELTGYDFARLESVSERGFTDLLSLAIEWHRDEKPVELIQFAVMRRYLPWQIVNLAERVPSVNFSAIIEKFSENKRLGLIDAILRIGLIAPNTEDALDCYYLLEPAATSRTVTQIHASKAAARKLLNQRADVYAHVASGISL